MSANQTFFIAARQKPVMRIGTPLFLMLLLLLMPAGAFAQNVVDLTTAELKKKIDAREKVLIIDTRTSQEYGQGHLPAAINIPPNQFDSISAGLTKEKDVPLVFYCRGYS